MTSCSSTLRQQDERDCKRTTESRAGYKYEFSPEAPGSLVSASLERELAVARLEEDEQGVQSAALKTDDELCSLTGRCREPAFQLPKG